MGGGGQAMSLQSPSKRTDDVTYILFQVLMVVAGFRGDQRGGMHTNEKLHVKLITIGSNGPYGRRKRSDLNPSISI